MPWQNPAQAAEMSKAAARWVPSSCAIAVATAGVCSMCETVATMTQSTCSGSRPAAQRTSNASPACGLVSLMGVPVASRISSKSCGSSLCSARSSVPYEAGSGSPSVSCLRLLE